MCGRFAFFSPREAVEEYFGLDFSLAVEPRYNVAPSQEIAVIRQLDDEGLSAAMLRWGLVPFWAKDSAIGHQMINARAETVADKPAFRQAFKRRRCVVLADGFYEWDSTGGRKTPYFVTLDPGHPFAMAGLWERWQKDGRPALETCTIITTMANDAIAGLHDRMPVIFDRPKARDWLAAVGERGHLKELLQPYSGTDLVAWPVSRSVNRPENQGVELIARVD